jgi:hypothetical protein
MAKAFSTRGVEMLKLKYVAAFAAALALMASDVS